MAEKEFITGVVRYVGDNPDVVIPEGLDVIGVEAFAHSKVRSVTIPKSVRSIKQRAFYNCKELERVRMESSEVKIEDSAFERCPKLRRLELPDDFKTPEKLCVNVQLGYLKFGEPTNDDGSGITALTQILFWLEAGAPKFAPLERIDPYVKENFIEVLRMIAYDGSDLAFTSLAAQERYGLIPPDFLDETIALTKSVELRAAVLAYKSTHYTAEDLENIDAVQTAKAFGEVPYDLKDYQKYFTVKEQEDGYVLYDYKGREETIVITDRLNGRPVVGIGEKTFAANETLKSVVLPATLTRIGREAFSECVALRSVTLPASLKSIDHDAFLKCSHLQSVQYEGDLKSWCEIEDEGSLVLRYVSEFCIQGKPLTDLVVPQGIERVSSIFSYYYGLRSATLGCDVTEIGDAFFGCSALESVTIGKKVKRISDKAFPNGGALHRVNYEGSLEDWLTVTNEGTNLFSAAKEFFVAGNPVTDLVLPKGTKEVKDNAFVNAEFLTSVTFPSGLKTIGRNAFWGCHGLSEVKLPDSLQKLEKTAFGDCVALKTVTLGKGIKTVDVSTFRKCCDLTLRFEGTLQEWLSVETFELTVFFRSFRIDEEYFFTNVKEFYVAGEKVTDLVIPDGVKKIKKNAFCGCRFLQSITLPESVTQLEKDIFLCCENLKTVCYLGDLSQWHEVKNQSALLKNATSFFVQGKKVADLVLPQGIECVKACEFSRCGFLTSVTLPDSVLTVKEGAFEYCKNLRSVHLGNGVKKIERNAFYGSGIKTITLGVGLRKIEEGVFGTCHSLTDIYYAGTRSRWLTVQKAEDWFKYGSESKVRCADD